MTLDARARAVGGAWSCVSLAALVLFSGCSTRDDARIVSSDVTTTQAVAPETSISTGPARFTNDINDTSFSYSSPTGVAFSYRRDSGTWSAWSATASVTLPPVPFGVHTFEVKARNAALEEDATPAAYTWRVIDAAAATYLDLSTQMASVDYWIYGEERLSFFGFSVAAGNINDGSRADIIVGAPTKSCAGASPNCGRVYIMFDESFPGTKDLTAAAADLTLTGASSLDQLGEAVAIANLNGDAYGDLIIAAPEASPAGRTRAGRVYVLLGRPAASWSSVTLADADMVIDGWQANHETGLSLSTGDVNGDGYADLLMDAEYAAPAGRANAGVVWVILGRDTLPAAIDLATYDTGVVEIRGAAAGDRLRVSGASNVNGDLGGVEDVVMLAHKANGGDGSAYVVHGTATWDRSNPSRYVVDLATSADVRIDAPAGALMEAAAVGGNFNGDNASGVPLNDIVLGARGAGGGAGAVYVIYGSTSLPAILDLEATQPDVQLTGEAGSGLGASVGLADVNNDMYADLLAGAWGTNGRGRVIVMAGTPFERGAKVTYAPGDASPNVPSGRILGAGDSHYLGFSVATGNFNADGYTDVLIGAVFASHTGIAEAFAGEAYVVLGPVCEGDLVLAAELSAFAGGDACAAGPGDFQVVGGAVGQWSAGGTSVGAAFTSEPGFWSATR